MIGVSHHRNLWVGAISATADQWRRGMPTDTGSARHVGSDQLMYRGLQEKAARGLWKTSPVISSHESESTVR